MSWIYYVPLAASECTRITIKSMLSAYIIESCATVFARVWRLKGYKLLQPLTASPVPAAQCSWRGLCVETVKAVQWTVYEVYQTLVLAVAVASRAPARLCLLGLRELAAASRRTAFCFEISAFLPSQVDDWQPGVLSVNSQLSSDWFLCLLFLQSFVSILTIQSDLKRNGVIRKKVLCFSVGVARGSFLCLIPSSWIQTNAKLYNFKCEGKY